MIKVETFLVGHLSTNCYIITDETTNRRAIIDPGYKNADLLKRIKKLGKDTFDYILLTHGHFDHIWYAEELRSLTGAKLVISKEDSAFLLDGRLNLSSVFGIKNFPQICADMVVSDGDKLKLGSSEFSFMSTPGHTVGSGCFIFFDDKVIFSGDTLFKLSQGRTDFPTSDQLMMVNSLKRLASLQGDFTVYPGHNEATTLEFERQNNPFVSV